MSKKVAISITLGALAVIYLFLLVALPALLNVVSTYSENVTAIEETSDFDSANLTFYRRFPPGTVFPRLQKVINEVSPTPMAMHFVPGVIGAFIIVGILKSKKGVKKDE